VWKHRPGPQSAQRSLVQRDEADFDLRPVELRIPDQVTLQRQWAMLPLQVPGPGRVQADVELMILAQLANALTRADKANTITYERSSYAQAGVSSALVS
jgi:hypothetical protein